MAASPQGAAIANLTSSGLDKALPALQLTVDAEVGVKTKRKGVMFPSRARHVQATARALNSLHHTCALHVAGAAQRHGLNTRGNPIVLALAQGDPHVAWYLAHVAHVAGSSIDVYERYIGGWLALQ